MIHYDRSALAERLRDVVTEVRMALYDASDWDRYSTHELAVERRHARSSLADRLDDILEETVELLTEDADRAS